MQDQSYSRDSKPASAFGKKNSDTVRKQKSGAAEVDKKLLLKNKMIQAEAVAAAEAEEKLIDGQAHVPDNSN